MPNLLRRNSVYATFLSVIFGLLSSAIVFLYTCQQESAHHRAMFSLRVAHANLAVAHAIENAVPIGSLLKFQYDGNVMAGQGRLLANMRSLFRGAAAGVDVAVYRGPVKNTYALVYRSSGKDATSPYPNGNCWLFCGSTPSATTLDLAGQKWHVVISDRPAPVLLAYRGALALLVAGLLSTVLCTRYVHDQQTRTARVVSLVERRTTELRSLNAILTKDIEARKVLTDELERSGQEVRELAEHNLRVKEGERKRIAREIHDELGQSMLALRIDLDLLAREAGMERCRECVGSALSKIDRIMEAMRAIINELRPAVLDLGLDAAVEWEVTKFERRTGIDCSLDLPSIPLEIGDEIATALYRIVQESMTNIMRHAQARHVTISLWCENDWLFLRLADDGIGMRQQCRRKAKSFGLIGIAERVHALRGVFSTDSTPGSGTTLSIAVPYAPVIVMDAA